MKRHDGSTAPPAQHAWNETAGAVRAYTSIRAEERAWVVARGARDVVGVRVQFAKA